MKTLVIEDEGNVRKGFIKLLQTFCPEVDIIGEAETIESALDILNSKHIELLFLDINLPDGSGFDLLHRISPFNFQVIFVTAYDQYAVNAFKIGAVDYLLKPVSPELLIKAVSKTQWLLKTSKGLDEQGHSNITTPTSNTLEKILLKDRDALHIVPIQDILFCEADGSYTKFQLTDGRSIFTSLNLKEYEDILTDCAFFRVHYSYLANINHIKEVSKVDGGSILMTNEMRIPLSTRRKNTIINILKQKFLN